MTVKIGSNIASIQAQRRLGEATASLGKIYERLSSGQRINTASDDAAGLAIANDLNSKNRVYTQAIRNGNDGISLLNIADSANETVSGIITRIRELAEQSANGTYSNKQRVALDNEAQALSKEFLRIAQTTSFNGVKVFNGSLGDGLRLQLGYGVEGSIKASVGGSIGSGSVAAATSFATEKISREITLGDLNGDGILDLVSAGEGDDGGYATIRLGTGTGSFGAATSFTTESSYSTAVTLGDLNGDGVLDLVTAGTDGGGYATVRLGSGSGSFGAATSFTTESSYSTAVTLGDLNGDGVLDLVTAGNGSGGYATVRLGTGTGSFGAATSFTTEVNSSILVTLGDLNGDGVLDLVTSGYGGGGYATVRLGTGTGSFGIATSYTTEDAASYAVSLGDLNGDGILDIITAGDDGINGRATVRLGTGTGSFGAATSFSTESTRSYAITLGDLNGDGVLDLVTAGEDSNVGYATVRLGNTQDGLGALLKFSLKTKADALQAMGSLQRAQENLAKQRGVIGAAQSRIGIALQGLASSKENFSAAESRIRDADISAEAANLIRTQILQQAATSVLAQANQGPALALTLLR